MSPTMHPPSYDEMPDLLRPLSFLVGTWRGTGVGGYPTIEDFTFGQEITFEYYGKPLLAYSSRTWKLDPARDPGDDNAPDPEGPPLARESGFWRPQPGNQLEVLLAHPTGLVEVFLGEITPLPNSPKIELATDVVARTPTAKEVTGERRLYGLVGDELMYAMDMAAVGQPLQPHLSARLRRHSPDR